MLTKFLLPKGKVHNNYMKYVGWSFLSNIIISTESVLSTHSMLSACNHNAASEFAVSINYISKDLVGQLGSLVIINKIGQKVDKESKKIVIFSTVCQQVSTIAECATPLLPISMFIPIAGLANIGKNISFMSFGAINAKIIQKLAQEDNIGEIYTKITIINTLGSSIGMILGLIFAAKIPDHHFRLGVMPFLTCMRIYSYNKAIKNLI